MKKVITILCSVVLVVSCFCFPALAENAIADDLYEEVFGDCELIDGLTEVEKIALQQRDAVLAVECLLSSGLLNAENRYVPDWYGGRYINKENILVIKLVNGYSYMEKTISEKMDKDAAYLFEYTDISLKDLDALAEMAGEEMDVLPIHSISVSQTDSMVYLNMADTAQLNKQNAAYQRLAGTPHIAFKAQAAPEFTTALKGGDILYKMGSGGSALSAIGTIGYCGRYNGQNCILTAGHVINGLSKVYFGSTTNYTDLNSTNSFVQFSNGEAGDYALAAMGNQNTRTNLVKLSSNTAGSISDVFYSENYNFDDMGYEQGTEGRYVFKYGYVTGLTYGQIIDVKEPSSPPGYNVTINGLVKVENIYGMDQTLALAGDSGGPVWYINSADERVLTGVVSSQYSIGGQEGKGLYFSPLYHVNNFTPYL